MQRPSGCRGDAEAPGNALRGPRPCSPSSPSTSGCVCVCMSECVRERECVSEREREIERGTERVSARERRERLEVRVRALHRDLRPDMKREFNQNLSGNEGYYTACSSPVISNNSCSKLHCQKASRSTSLLPIVIVNLRSEGRCKATWKREFKLPWREADGVVTFHLGEGGTQTASYCRKVQQQSATRIHQCRFFLCTVALK